MNHFSCPVCEAALSRDGSTLRCAAGHSFDISRHGYVNLLPSHHRRSKQPGDNKLMVASRRRFLDADHFGPLRSALTDAIASIEATELLVDVGCGEGYFTHSFASSVAGVYGVDVSREAISAAAKRYKGISLAVGNTTRLPLIEETFDIATVIFAPFSDDIARVVKDGGTLIRVTPGADHLRELKEMIYRAPRAHERASLEIERFTHLAETRVQFSLTLDQQGRTDLIGMTPMQHRTELAMRDRAIEPPQLTVSAEVWIDLFRKVSGSEAA